MREHPVGFWYVFWGELAERASFYGMRALLVEYLVAVFLYPDNRAAAWGNGFTAGCYIAPLLGGWLADRYFGKYKTIVWFSLPYIMGHVLLGLHWNQTCLLIALGLLMGGSGSIKPNTSTLMGRIYETQHKEHLMSEAFSYYYAAINIGAALSSFALPIVRNHYKAMGQEVHGYEVALMLPTILMAVALLIFATGKKHYPVDHISKEDKSPEQKAEERATLLRLAGIFSLIALFWFVYDQSASTWITFASKHTDLTLKPFNIHITGDQMQWINPVLIVAFTPIFNWMWTVIRFGGREVKATQKMMIGFLIVIACTGVLALAGALSASGLVSVWWIVLATFVITMAELCVSVVGLEFAFRQASPATHSSVTAAFLVTVFVGDSIGTVYIDRLYDHISMGWFFGIQLLIMVGVAIVFHFVARQFQRSEEQMADSPVTAEIELVAH
ncbi:MAG: peptide MFS transporter [Candidatus Xenobia bacterium]